MKYLTVAALSILCFIVGLFAPFVVPFALLRTDKDATELAWSWWDTPDEPDFIGFYEPTVYSLYKKYGWFMSAWYWFGLRNRAHGFYSLFSQPAPSHWPEVEGMWERDGFFLWRKRVPVVDWFQFHLVFGWTVYASPRYPSGYEYRPQMSIKTRRA